VTPPPSPEALIQRLREEAQYQHENNNGREDAGFVCAAAAGEIQRLEEALRAKDQQIAGLHDALAGAHGLFDPEADPALTVTIEAYLGDCKEASCQELKALHERAKTAEGALRAAAVSNVLRPVTAGRPAGAMTSGGYGEPLRSADDEYSAINPDFARENSNWRNTGPAIQPGSAEAHTQRAEAAEEALRAAERARDEKDQDIDRLCRLTEEWEAKGAEWLAALQAKEQEIARLRAALKAVECTARKDCWCDRSWDAFQYGHQRKCQFANEVLALASSGAETP